MGFEGVRWDNMIQNQTSSEFRFPEVGISDLKQFFL